MDELTERLIYMFLIVGMFSFLLWGGVMVGENIQWQDQMVDKYCGWDCPTLEELATEDGPPHPLFWWPGDWKESVRASCWACPSPWTVRLSEDRCCHCDCDCCHTGRGF